MKPQMGFWGGESGSGSQDRVPPEEHSTPHMEHERLLPSANWTAVTIPIPPMRAATTPARRALERIDRCLWRDVRKGNHPKAANTRIPLGMLRALLVALSR